MGKILCIPRIHIKHDIDENWKKISWKNYYHFRNEIHGLIKNFPVRGRLFAIVAFLRAFASILKGTSIELTKIKLIAYKNRIFGKLGLHPIYLPGWKPKQK